MFMMLITKPTQINANSAQNLGLLCIRILQRRPLWSVIIVEPCCVKDGVDFMAENGGRQSMRNRKTKAKTRTSHEILHSAII
jgi:hypothetical protein